LGLKKKYKYNPISTKSCASSHTSSETSELSDFDKSLEGDNETLTTDEGGTIQSKLVEHILSLSREHCGRWDLDFTIQILEASGIPNVSFDTENTSKGVRAISKLSAALRENVERCKKAVDMIKEFGEEVSIRNMTFLFDVHPAPAYHITTDEQYQNNPMLNILIDVGYVS
jgi:hypothetical protein